MSGKELQSIEQKLDLLIRLNAYLATKGMKVADAAPILHGLGMSSSEIAMVLGSTPNAVNARISEAKANKKNVKIKNKE